MDFNRINLSDYRDGVFIECEITRDRDFNRSEVKSFTINFADFGITGDIRRMQANKDNPLLMLVATTDGVWRIDCEAMTGEQLSESEVRALDRPPSIDGIRFDDFGP